MLPWEILLPSSHSRALFPSLLSHISLSTSNEISQQWFNSNMLLWQEMKKIQGWVVCRRLFDLSPVCVLRVVSRWSGWLQRRSLTGSTHTRVMCKYITNCVCVPQPQIHDRKPISTHQWCIQTFSNCKTHYPCWVFFMRSPSVRFRGLFFRSLGAGSGWGVLVQCWWVLGGVVYRGPALAGLWQKWGFHARLVANAVLLIWPASKEPGAHQRLLPHQLTPPARLGSLPSFWASTHVWTQQCSGPPMRA